MISVSGEKASDTVARWLEKRGLAPGAVTDLQTRDRICEDLGLQMGTVIGCLGYLVRKHSGEAEVAQANGTQPEPPIEPALTTGDTSVSAIETIGYPPAIEPAEDTALAEMADTALVLADEVSRLTALLADTEGEASALRLRVAELEEQLVTARASEADAKTQVDEIWDALWEGAFAEQPEAEPDLIGDFAGLGEAINSCIRRLSSEPYRKRTRSVALPQWAQWKALRLAFGEGDDLMANSLLMRASMLEAAADACFLVAARREK